ncbi:hypothetical protein C8Q78DRAFT_134165 [Trametes maxima]|nr:hypothetical protein C8Q78DRAFT_134165 [Trametes maxima]
MAIATRNPAGPPQGPECRSSDRSPPASPDGPQTIALAAILGRAFINSPHLSSHCSTVALQGPLPAPAPPKRRPQKMSTTSKRSTRACMACSRRKVRCDRDEGQTRCRECLKRDLLCESRAHPPDRPCEACRRAHLGCDWPGHGPCTHCSRAPTPCSFDSAVSGSPGPVSPSGSSEPVQTPPPPERKRWLEVVM